MDVNLNKLKYTSKGKQKLSYNSNTPRKDNLTFKNPDYLKECIEKGTNKIMASYEQNYEYDILIPPIWEHQYKKTIFKKTIFIIQIILVLLYTLRVYQELCLKIHVVTTFNQCIQNLIIT